MDARQSVIGAILVMDSVLHFRSNAVWVQGQKEGDRLSVHPPPALITASELN